MSAVAIISEDVAKGSKDSSNKARQKSKLSFETLEGDVARKIDALFGVTHCLIEVNPGHVLMPPKYRQIGDKILSFPVKQDDVWVVSYPRTGSTWAQEMVWCIGNDLDLDKARTTLQQLRTPLLELTALMEHDGGDWSSEFENSVHLVEQMASPRFIKSHLPRELLPEKLATVKPKMIYVARNPKDMCVSYYHYCMLVHDLKGSLEDFCDLFLKDKAPIGPIWNHILGFWKLRHEPNILFLRYEDMKKDLPGTIRLVANFLDKDLTDGDVALLADHLSFSKMRANPAVNLEPIMEKKNGPGFTDRTGMKFLRKGEVGDWRNHMGEELSERFDTWTEQNLKGTGLTFETK